MPQISVILPVYNANNSQLAQCIESVLAQDFTDFELCIILDSPDNSENRALIASYAKKDERIKPIYNEKNLGLAGACNKAISLSCGKYIARIDQDDIALKTRFSLQKNYLEENELDFVGGFVQTIDDNGTTISPCIKVPTTNSHIRKTLKINSCIFHSTFFLKRTVFDALGGYNFPYIEDYQLLLKARKANYKLGNVPEVILLYRMSMGSYSRSNLFWQYLCMRYIQNQFFARSPSKQSIDDYCKARFSEKKAYKYGKSADCLTQALECIQSRRIFSAIPKLFVAFFGSRYYFEKICRYVVQYLG